MTTPSKNPLRLEYKAAFPVADSLGALVRRVEVRTLRFKRHTLSLKEQASCEELQRRYDEASVHVDYVRAELDRVNREIDAIERAAEARANANGSFEQRLWAKIADIAGNVVTRSPAAAVWGLLDVGSFLSEVSADIRRTVDFLQAHWLERDELNAYYKVAQQRRVDAGAAFDRSGCSYRRSL